MREVVGTLTERVGGSVMGDDVATHEWELRFSPMRIKRIGPSLIPTEVVVPAGSLAAVGDGAATLECVYTGRVRDVEAGSVVMVTSRQPQDSLYHALADRFDVRRVGDCLAPGTIATAVYSGHRCAREMDAGPIGAVAFRREEALAP